MSLVTSIRLVVVDGITAPLRRITNNFSVLKRSMEAGANMRKFAAETSMATSAVSSFARQARAVVGAPTEAFESFEHEMARVKGLTKTTGAEFAALNANALALGSSIGEFSALDVAQGMSEYGMAGRASNEIISAMPRTLDLATAAQVSLADTISVTTGIMGGFGIEANKTGEVADILTSTFTGSKTTLKSLGETISYAGSVAKDAGVSLKTTAIMAGLLGNASIDGSRAGTTLSAMITRLSGAGRGKGSKFLAAAGIQLEKLQNGKKVLRGPLEMLRDIKKYTDSLSSPVKKSRFLSGVFGAQALPGVKQLMANLSSKKFNQLTKDVNGSAGATAKLAVIMRATAKNATMEMKSAIDGLFITLGSKLAPELTKIKNLVRDGAIWIGKLAAKYPGLTTGIMLTVGAVALLATGLTGLMFMVSTIASGLGVLLPILGAVSTAFGITGAAGSTAGAAIGAGWVAALWPIALVVLAITAVAAAAYLVYEYWDPIRAWFLNAWDRFQAASTAAKVVIVAVMGAIALAALFLLGPILLIPAAIVGVVAAIKNWDTIKVYLAKVGTWFSDTWDGVTEGFWDLAEEIGEVWETMLGNKYFKIFLSTLDTITTPLQVLFNLMSKVTSMGASGIASAAGAIYETGKEVLGVVSGSGEGKKGSYEWGTLQGEGGVYQNQISADGKLKISIDSEGRVYNTRLDSNGGDIDYDLETDMGPQMSMLPG